MNISHATILCYDRGDHTFLAEKIAETAKEVLFYTPILGPHPVVRDDQIGFGLDGVEKIDDFEEYKDKVDYIFFPSVYDGEKALKLREEGHRVFGSWDEIELNRILFLDTLVKVGLKPVPTHLAIGIDEAMEYLTGKENKWLKTPYYRGDFNTIHYANMKTFTPWFNDMKCSLGERGSSTMEILIQDDFPAEVETGGDRYNIDGQFTKKGLVGYEIKDKGYMCKVFDEMPKIINDVDMKIGPELGEHKYRAAWSTELRVNKKGEVRFTDATARFGAPPGGLMCEIFDHDDQSFGQTVCDIADGIVPELKEVAKFGATIVMASWFNEKKEICVQFPKEFKQNVKLQNCYKYKDEYYCVENETDGYFGEVVAWGNSVKEATEKAKEIADSLVCLGKEYDSSVFDKASECIEKGERFGINFKGGK